MTTSKKLTLAACITSTGATKLQYRKLTKNIDELCNVFNVVIDSKIVANNLAKSRSVGERIASINRAFKQGELVMSWDGGFNSIELLGSFNKLKAREGAVFIGYSDNTILVNTFTVKQLCRSFYGPMLEDLSRNPSQQKIATNLLRDLYYRDFSPLTKIVNSGHCRVFRPGTMEGPIWGGNNYTFDLLQGTEFSPDFARPYILFMEGEDVLKNSRDTWKDFIRNIDSVLLQNGASKNLRGLIIGSFPTSVAISPEEMNDFFSSRYYLRGVPIIYDFPCGHIVRSVYLPIGEVLKITATKKKVMFN